MAGRMAAPSSRGKILAASTSRAAPAEGWRARARIGDIGGLSIATAGLHGEAVVIRLIVKEARARDLSRLGMGRQNLGLQASSSPSRMGDVVRGDGQRQDDHAGEALRRQRSERRS